MLQTNVIVHFRPSIRPTWMEVLFSCVCVLLCNCNRHFQVFIFSEQLIKT